jgi:hypothetical protein
MVVCNRVLNAAPACVFKRNTAKKSGDNTSCWHHHADHPHFFITEYKKSGALMATTSSLTTADSSARTRTSSTSNACQVRVGVRIRPLTSQEAGEGGNSVLAVQQQQQHGQQQEIRLGQRRFTYDAVFDTDVSQHDLYQSVSAPLLTSVLDGYNATVRNVCLYSRELLCQLFVIFFDCNLPFLLSTHSHSLFLLLCFALDIGVRTDWK